MKTSEMNAFFQNIYYDEFHATDTYGRRFQVREYHCAQPRGCRAREAANGHWELDLCRVHEAALRSR